MGKINNLIIGYDLVVEDPIHKEIQTKTVSFIEGIDLGKIISEIIEKFKNRQLPIEFLRKEITPPCIVIINIEDGSKKNEFRFFYSCKESTTGNLNNFKDFEEAEKKFLTHLLENNSMQQLLKSVLICVPKPLEIVKEKEFNSWVIIYLKKNINKKIMELLNSLIVSESKNNCMAVSFGNFLRDLYVVKQIFLCIREMDEFLVKNIRKYERTYALRSSITSIMARNMSHNIDSHVTPRGTVEAVRKRLGELSFQEDLDTIQLLKGRLDEYRQERADFLAEITSEPLTTTKPIHFYRGVILPLIENVLFMDNIARNEGICYRDKTNNRLRIRVFFGDTELKVKYVCATSQGGGTIQPYSTTYPDQGIPYTARCIDCKYKSSTEDHTAKPSELVSIPCKTTDIEIELPGPVGEHAFYGFLENFIRNAAKHNRQYFDDIPEENLEVNIRISEPQDKQEKKEFYVIEIWDNVTDPNKEVKATVDGRYCGKLCDLIRAYIESEVIDETGRKKEQAYGITEMKVNATLLRGSTDFMRMKEFLEVSGEPRKATQYEKNKKQYQEVEKERLIYRFRLMKAKKMCGVFPNWNDETSRKKLQDHGIWIFKTVKELKEAVMPGEKSGEDVPKSAASFRFAVFDCSGGNGKEIAEKIPDLLPFLPFRVLVLKGNNNIGNLPRGVVEVNESGSAFPSDPNEIMVWLWKHWLQRWGSDPKILEIYLDQSCNESPTNEWIKYANNFNTQIGNNAPFKVRVWSRSQEHRLCCGEERREETHIFFDRHGGGVKASGIMGNFLGADSYIFLDKLNKDFSMIFNPISPKNNEPWLLPFELIESGLLRILVIDERLAEACLKTVEDTDARKLGYVLSNQMSYPPTIWHIAFGAKVYICTHFGFEEDTPKPLHKSSYSQAEGKDKLLLPYLSVKWENNQLCCEYKTSRNGDTNKLDSIDMLIVHQGILDEWIKGTNPENFLKEIQNHIPFVVVDSGRGIPPNLPAGFKFLPVSVLLNFMASKRVAKYSLTRTVMGLVRKQWKGM